MSFFSSIGKIGKGLIGGVAKVAGNVVGGYIGDPHLGSDMFSGSSATSGAPVAGSVSLTGGAQTSPSLSDQLRGLLLVASGNKPIQTQVESSALPSWLLPVALIGALILAAKALFK